MTRFVAALLAVAVLANAARADMPPPLGRKCVSVDHEVVLGKGVTGYIFVLPVGRGPHYVELPVGKPVAMPTDGNWHSCVTLYAVPQDAVKEFKSAAELLEALEASKVKGAHALWFHGRTDVPFIVLGNSVKWTHTITAIDEKDGIKTKVEGTGAEKPTDRTEKQGRPSVLGGACVSGGAGALGLFLGGLWLVGRARRKV